MNMTPYPEMPFSTPLITNTTELRSTFPHRIHQLDYLTSTIGRLTDELTIMREQQRQM